MSKKIITLLTALLISIGSTGLELNQALAAEESTNAYLLLNVKSDGVLSARDLVFKNVDTGAEVWLRDLMNTGRSGPTKFIMKPLSAGKYYLSSIHPTVNARNNAPSIEKSVEDGVITILADTINYIGDFIFRSRERGRGVDSSVDYEPNPNTLMAAVSAERDLFERLDVVVSIAGNAPVSVDKKLLGL
ncbi:MAG: hypothetical protein ACI80L_002372 [Pseudohongiellaceae bacterium]|jgi:hypothetical protein